MLRIRPEQIEALRAAAQLRRLEAMVDSVRRHFPANCAAGGERRTRAYVVEGLARAAELGFTTDRNVRRFLALQFTFGVRFDSDPECAWAAAILGGAEGRTETAVMDLLYQAGLDALPDDDGVDA